MARVDSKAWFRLYRCLGGHDRPDCCFKKRLHQQRRKFTGLSRAAAASVSSEKSPTAPSLKAVWRTAKYIAVPLCNTRGDYVQRRMRWKGVRTSGPVVFAWLRTGGPDSSPLLKRGRITHLIASDRSCMAARSRSDNSMSSAEARSSGLADSVSATCKNRAATSVHLAAISEKRSWPSFKHSHPRSWPASRRKSRYRFRKSAPPVPAFFHHHGGMGEIAFHIRAGGKPLFDF